MMKITTKDGDILAAKTDVIGHQVNCKGIMGAGLARQIRERHAYVYAKYKHFCMSNKPSALLGRCLLSETINYSDLKPPDYVANLFGQKGTSALWRQTDYDAVRNALTELEREMRKLKLQTLGLPYGMGCGLGGGDWRVMESIINEVFDESPITVTIYRLTPRGKEN